MIIPIGHEETLLRRIPIVSFSLIGLNILVFIFGLFYFDKGAEARLGEAMEYYWVRKDYLVIPKAFERAGIDEDHVARDFGTLYDEDLLFEQEEYQQYIDEQNNPYSYDEANIEETFYPAPEPDVDAEQEVLEEMAHKALNRSRTGFYIKWAIHPGHPTILGSFFYMFLHSDWKVLLINMYFLYLVGTVLEDRYGRAFFTCFYLLGGLLTGLICQLQFSNSAYEYLVNATGPVSVVLGAFLVCYRSSKITFAFIFTFLVRGTFALPALIVLPLWLVLKGLSLLLTTSLVALVSMGIGLAMMDAWSSFWGMLLGAGVIALVRQTPLEARLVPPSAVHEDESDLLRAALKEERLGRGAVALDILKKGVREQPENTDMLLEYWRIANLMRHQGDIVLAGQKLIREDLDQDDSKMAFMRWKEIREGAPESPLPLALVSKLTEALVAEQYFLEAEEVLRQSLKTMRNPMPLHLVRLMELAVAMRNPIASEIASLALALPNLTVEDKHNLKMLQAKSQEYQTAGVGPATGAIEVSATGGELFNAPAAMTKNVHSLKCHAAQPVGADGVQLSLVVDGAHQKKVPYNQIKVVATGIIREPGQKPYLLIDLVFDPLFDILPQHRVLRIDSRGFNPRTLVPKAPDTKAAFTRFLQILLKKSGADPLPDGNAAIGNPYTEFPNLRAYERAIYF